MEVNKMERNKSKLVMVVAIAAILGIGTYAFADRGGFGMGDWGHRQGGYHMDWGGPGYGYKSDLSEEDYKKLDDQMQTFYKETESIRQKIYEKELALRSELAKENPDAKKASDLQKEMSEFESDFNQKKIDHMLALRKANPNFNRGFMGRGGMMGSGPGYCWR
jgi:zinc resistance-associated protein